MKTCTQNYILAFDTATEHLSVAVLNMKGDVLAEHNELAFRHLSDHLHPAIETCMQTANVSFSELAFVACTKGPGSFTSVRVGLAAAKGFSFALNIPIVSYNSLESLVLSYLSKHAIKQKIHVWINAHGGNVYKGTFNAKGETTTEIQSIPVAQAAQEIQAHDVLIGNGVLTHSSHVPNTVQTQDDFTYLKAKDLALQCLKAFQENTSHVGDDTPLYIHPLHYHKTYNADGTLIKKA